MAALTDSSLANVIMLFDNVITILFPCQQIASLVWWINSWINFVIYGWRSKQFRQAYKKMLGFKRCDQNVSNNSQATQNSWAS